MFSFLPLRILVFHYKRAFFDSNFIIQCFLWASRIYSFGWLLQASLDSCYFPYIFFLSFVPSYQDSPIDYLFHPRHMDNSPILVRWLSIPSPPTMTPLSIMVHFLLDSSSLDCWSILALRLLLHRESKLFMPCWIKALGPNTIAMCIVLWLLWFLMAHKMLHQLNKLLRRHLLRRTRLEPWSRMYPYQRLFQGLTPIEVVPDHLEFLMEHCLSHTQVLKRWIPCLWCFRGWTHKTLNSVRSRVSWPTLFCGSMLKAVQASYLFCFLLMFIYFSLSLFVSFCWCGLLFIPYLLYPKSLYIYTYIHTYMLFISLFTFYVSSPIYIFITS